MRGDLYDLPPQYVADDVASGNPPWGSCPSLTFGCSARRTTTRTASPTPGPSAIATTRARTRRSRTRTVRGPSVRSRATLSRAPRARSESWAATPTRRTAAASPTSTRSRVSRARRPRPSARRTSRLRPCTRCTNRLRPRIGPSCPSAASGSAPTTRAAIRRRAPSSGSSVSRPRSSATTRPRTRPLRTGSRRTPRKSRSRRHARRSPERSSTPTTTSRTASLSPRPTAARRIRRSIAATTSSCSSPTDTMRPVRIPASAEPRAAVRPAISERSPCPKARRVAARPLRLRIPACASTVIPVYVVGLNTNASFFPALNCIADESGGQLFAATDEADLLTVLESLLDFKRSANFFASPSLPAFAGGFGDTAQIGAVVPSHLNENGDLSSWSVWSGTVKSYQLDSNGLIPVVTAPPATVTPTPTSGGPTATPAVGTPTPTPVDHSRSFSRTNPTRTTSARRPASRSGAPAASSATRTRFRTWRPMPYLRRPHRPAGRPRSPSGPDARCSSPARRSGVPETREDFMPDTGTCSGSPCFDGLMTDMGLDPASTTDRSLAVLTVQFLRGGKTNFGSRDEILNDASIRPATIGTIGPATGEEQRYSYFYQDDAPAAGRRRLSSAPTTTGRRRRATRTRWETSSTPSSCCSSRRGTSSTSRPTCSRARAPRRRARPISTSPTASRKRRKVLFAGANDGFLHAFDGGVWNRDTVTLQPDVRPRNRTRDLRVLADEPARQQVHEPSELPAAAAVLRGRLRGVGRRLGRPRVHRHAGRNRTRLAHGPRRRSSPGRTRLLRSRRDAARRHSDQPGGRQLRRDSRKQGRFARLSQRRRRELFGGRGGVQPRVPVGHVGLQRHRRSLLGCVRDRRRAPGRDLVASGHRADQGRRLGQSDRGRRRIRRSLRRDLRRRLRSQLHRGRRRGDQARHRRRRPGPRLLRRGHRDRARSSTRCRGA